MAREEESIKVLARNRRASHDYEIDETLEAGLKLKGTEVKSMRQGKVDVSDAYGIVEGGEVYLLNMHIAPYSHASAGNHEPKRPRKLLLNRREIDYLYGRVRERGFTLVPLKVYFRRGWAKVKIAVARGRSYHDRREKLKKREAEKRMRRAIRRRP